MKRGGKFLLLSGCLAATSCATQHTVQVRAIADTNRKLQYGGDLLADARAQLAMGAIGLAIESFRTLQRQQPDNVNAYAGLAASYAAMGRYDLTRTNYELALAYAPNDPNLLQALASALDKLGETEQAAQVRSEVRVAAARAAQPHLTLPVTTPLGVPRATSITVKVPEASPARAISQAPEPTIAGPHLGSAKVELATTRLSSIGNRSVAQNAQVAIPVIEDTSDVLALAQPPVERLTDSPTLGATTVNLHSARASLVSQRALEVNAEVAVGEPAERPAPRPLPRQAARPIALAAATRNAQSEMDVAGPVHGPYLERTSLREVALITIAHPANRETLRPRAPELPRIVLIAAPPADTPPSQPAPRSLLAAASVRWVPLRYASPQNIELLNAARADGLAARTRLALVDRGWRKVRIGNARSVRQHSLVLYSAGHWHVAAKLAAQFRCKAVRMTSVKSVIVLLGRDAALRRGAIAHA